MVLIYLAIVGWVVTIIGWVIFNHFSDNRETRKETRATIDKLNDEVEKLLKSSHTYYCSNKKVEQKIAESEIISSFNRMDGIIERLEKTDSEMKLQKKLADLYEAITGDDFGSERVNRNSELYTEKCSRLALLAENLRKTSEDWFINTYQ